VLLDGRAELVKKIDLSEIECKSPKTRGWHYAETVRYLDAFNGVRSVKLEIVDAAELAKLWPRLMQVECMDELGLVVDDGYIFNEAKLLALELPRSVRTFSARIDFIWDEFFK
jgi:hypothetical protein